MPRPRTRNYADDARDYQPRGMASALGETRQQPQHGSRARYRKCTDGDDGDACQACKDQEARYARAYRARKALERAAAAK